MPAIGFLATAGTSLHAQLVSDSVTRTLANVTNAVTGTVTVGTNGSFTLLTITFLLTDFDQTTKL